jgi:hypothetical protein
MSKRSKKKRAEMKQQEQAALEGGTVAKEGATKSIASLVLQRIKGMGVLQAVDEQVNGEKMPVKAVPLPDRGVPTVVEEEVWPDHWPKCPEHVSKVEWRRAIQNKEYYEEKWLEADGKIPWFRFPRYSYQYSEFVYVTPEMAEQLLQYMPVNRPSKDAWVETIKRDILHERWLQTHESIAINLLGNMHDGQHRAKAIKEAGRGWPIYITWNVPPEALFVTDSGEKRKVNEKLGLLFPESKLNAKSIALCRSMMWGLSARGIRYSESEISEFAVKHHDVILWVGARLRGHRADLQAVIAKALLWWGEEKVGSFVRKLTKIEFEGDGDPAKALYLWIQKAKSEGRRTSYSNPVVYYKKALAAISHHIAGESKTKIYQKNEDVFEWLPGWEVPGNAPCKGKVLTSPPEEPEEPEEDEDEE